MKCAQAEKLIMAEAAGALDPEQSGRLKEHLRSCEACRSEMQDVADAGRVFAAAAPPVAPANPALWERIESEIAGSPSRSASIGWSWLWRAGTAGAAAAIALVAFQATVNEPVAVPTADRPAAVAKAPEPAVPEKPERITVQQPRPQVERSPARLAKAPAASAKASRPANLPVDTRKKVTRVASAPAERTSETPKYRVRGVPRSEGTYLGRDSKFAAGSLSLNGGAEVTTSSNDATLTWDDGRDADRLYTRSDNADGPSGGERFAGALSRAAVGEAVATASASGGPELGITAGARSYAARASSHCFYDRATGGVRSVSLGDNARSVEMVYTSADARARTLFSY